MKYLALLAVLPAIAMAQDSQTTCVNTQPVSTCTTRSTAPPVQVAAPDVVGAYQRGAEAAARRQVLEQEAALAAEQRRTLQLQNRLLQQQLDQQQKLVAAEAAVIRQALAAFVEEQAALPEDQRIHDTVETGKRIAAIAHRMLGYEPSTEAFALVARQAGGAPEKP